MRTGRTMRAAGAHRTVADVVRQASAVPQQAVDHPFWMKYLRSLAVVQMDRPGVRTVLCLPTCEGAVGVLSVAVVEHLARLRSTTPLSAPSGADSGRRASVFTSGKYSDATMQGLVAGMPLINGSKLMSYVDVIRFLPEDFPDDRSDWALHRDTIRQWATRVVPPAEPARVHARVSATPVVVIGGHSALEADLGLLQSCSPGVALLADVGQGLGRWFRHPILVADPGAEAEPWLREVEPSLVIAVGAAGWRSPLRHALGAAPQLLVLDRRSGAAADVVEDIVLTEPTDVSTTPAPPHGIEAWSFKEQLAPAQGSSPEDLDEDLF